MSSCNIFFPTIIAVIYKIKIIQKIIFVKSFFEIRDLGDYPNNEKEFLVYSEQERNRMIKIFSKEFQKKLSVWYKREFTDDFEAKMRTLEKRLKEEVLPNFDASDYDLHNFPYERIEGDRIRLKAIAEVSLEVVVEKCIQATIDFVDNFRR